METKLGLHIATGPRNGYNLTAPHSRGFISFLADAFTESHPDSFRVFRPGADHGIYTYNGQHNWDIMPGFNDLSVDDMADQAANWWPKMRAAADAEESRLGVRIDAIQPRNESDSDERLPNEKLIAYERALMPLAEADGRILVVGSLSTNSPHWGQGLWQELYAPFIREAWERGHIYGRHSYFDFPPENDHKMRTFWEIDYLRQQGATGPIIVSEAGFVTFPGVDDFMAAIVDYDQMLQDYPEIGYAAIFTYGNWWNANIQSASARLGEYLRQNRFTKWEPSYTPDPPIVVPDDLPGGARIDYKRQYVLFHADTPMEWMLETRRVTHEAGFRVTIGSGADDAGIGNLLDGDDIIPLTDRVVIAVNPDMWGDEQHGDGIGLKGFFDFYYPRTDYTPINPSSATDCARRVLAALRGIDPDIPPLEIDVPVLWQCDPSWAAYPCGYGPKTLCQYGCLMTVYTMWLDYFGLNQERDVLEENNYFRDSGGFSGYYLNSMAMSKVYTTVADEGWLTFASSGSVMHDNVKAYLLRGIPVPARVDFHPETPGVWEQHWVLIVGWDQDKGDYLINDPWLNRKSAYLRDLYDAEGNDVHTALFYYPLDNPLPDKPPLIGVHAPADGGDFHAGVIDEIAVANPDTVKVLSSHSEGSLSELKGRLPDANYIVRAFLSFGGRNVTPQQFVDWTLPDVERSINALGGSVAGIELHNEPNLYAEGLGQSWSNGLTFSWWYQDVIRLYRDALPGFRYIFPGLSPGESVPGVRLDSVSFMTGTADSIMISDDLGVHVYWSTQDGWPMSKALDEIRAIHLTFPSKKLWITEFSNNRPGVTPEQKASEYVGFGRACAGLGYVSGVAAYVVAANGPEWNWQSGSCETWLPVGMGGLINSLLK